MLQLRHGAKHGTISLSVERRDVMDERAARLLEEIKARQGGKQPFLVAIDGSSAGGKSTLGAMLAEKLDATLIHMDDFFLPPDLRTRQRLAQPGGNVHYERVLEQVLRPIRRGEGPVYGVFDCSVMAIGQTRAEPVRPVVIVEGAYSLHPALREFYDLKVFLEVDQDTQKARILRRNGPEKLHIFVERWIPLEQRYFAACGVRECCDIIL